jgi:acetyltransferase-like isoleucine patch superfamily enzyme
MHGCNIQEGVKINANTIINTQVVVEHDCDIASHNHIATGAIVCGSVNTQAHVFIGAGATVIQKVSIGHNVTIAAGGIGESGCGGKQACLCK